MHQFKHYLRFFVFIILILSFATGCQRIRSMAAVRYMERRLEEAREYQAEEYVPDLYEEVVGIFEEVRNAYDAQDYENAAERGGVGRERAQELVERARFTKSEALLSEARERRERAELNRGQTIDAELYNTILENFATADDQFRGEQYDRAIDNSRRVIEDTDRLLRNLAREAEENYEELERLENELINIDAETYASSFLVGFQDKMATVKKNVEEDHNYIQAIRNYRNAMELAQDTETETYRGRASEIIAEAEEKIAEAREKDAEELAPVQFNSSNELFSQNLRLFLNEEYERVVMNRDRFMDNLDTLLEVTYKRSAEREIEILRDGIESLRAADADTYLSTMMETVEEMLADSDAVYEDEAWEEAEELALDGQSYLDRIHDEYYDIVRVALNEALGEINKAEDAGAITFAFGALKSARDLYDQAEKRLEDLRYSRAIEMAEDTGEKAEIARQEAFKNRARQEIVQISRDIETKIRQGVKDYSPEELEDARTKLGEMEGHMDQAEYEEAVALAQVIKSRLSLGLQNVIEQTMEQMGKADEQLELARDYKAREYFPEEMEEAQAFFEKAKRYIDDERFQDALEEAARAEKRASELEQKSTRQWTLDELKVANTALNDARNAFAHEFAEELFEESVTLYFISQNLLKDKQYKEALDHAFEAQEVAQRAKHALLNENKALISDAKKYHANRHYPNDYLNSIAQYEKGSQFLEEQYYKQAYELLSEAAERLDLIVRSTREQRVDNKLKALEEKYQDLERTKKAEFMPPALDDIREKFRTIQREIDPHKFEEATEMIEENEAELQALLDRQENHIEQIVAGVEDEYQRLKKEERVERYAYESAQEADTYLRYLKSDLAQEDYQSAYDSYSHISVVLAEINLLVDEKAYVESLYRLMDSLQAINRQFATTLELGPELLKTNIYETIDIGVGWRGVVGSISPDRYKRKATELHKDFEAIKPPDHLKKIHRQADKTFEAFSNSADHFEKLVMANKMERDTVHTLIDNAFRFKKRTEAELNLLQIKMKDFRQSTPQRRSMFAYLAY